MESEYTIYLDMDGVIANFAAAFLKLSKEVTGEPISISGLDTHISHNIMTKGGVEFWANIPPYKDMNILIDYLKNNFLHINILSSTSNVPGSDEGKREWLTTHGLTSIVDDIILVKKASDKKTYASPSGILIDDFIKNYNDWNNVGGIGILHKLAQDTIKQLTQYV